MTLAFVLLTLLLAIASFVSLLKRNEWWVRGFDFPRIQVSFLIVAALITLPLLPDLHPPLDYTILALLLVSLIWQLIKIFPYTPFASPQVLSSRHMPEERRISLLVANVLMTNRNATELLRLISVENPDILLTLETDSWWQDQLEPLETIYPHTVMVPQDNLYGMHLYSKLELIDPEVKVLISSGIPSIHTTVRLRNSSRVRLFCLHPEPPSPSEKDTSVERDAELLLVARHIGEESRSCIVVGDLNDVSWSRTTRLFQKLSGLLDPRIGRGFYCTFHAKLPLFRWPLDHVFHSADFTLAGMRRLDYFGSDHFPVIVDLVHEPGADFMHEIPEAEEEEVEWAEEKIALGDPNEEWS